MWGSWKSGWPSCRSNESRSAVFHAKAHHQAQYARTAYITYACTGLDVAPRAHARARAHPCLPSCPVPQSSNKPRPFVARKLLEKRNKRKLFASLDEIVVGIDLGTTNSAISVVEDGLPVVVPNREGQEILPSVVSFGEGGDVLVGLDAKKVAAVRPDTTFYSVKRFIGRKYADVREEMELVPYEVLEGASGEALLKCPFLENGVITPEEVSSIILKEMIGHVESTYGRPVYKAVISVPAYFDKEQRKATIAAGELAGLQKVKLIKEPVASALGYGVDLNEEQTVMVFDLGGGTLDVSILEVGGGVIEVLATGGDPHLGGDDWDELLINWIVKDYLVPEKIEWRTPKIMSNLKGLAEYAKIKLSSGEKVAIRIPLGKGVKAVLTPHLFEGLSKHLFVRARTAIDYCCAQAGVEPVAITKQSKEPLVLIPKARAPVSEVLMVGGSTRMPSVHKFIENMTGFAVRESSIDPDKAVALGAAVQAGVLQGDVEDMMMMDIFQASLMRAFAKKHFEDEDDIEEFAFEE